MRGISVKGVAKSFANNKSHKFRRVLGGISLEVNRGEFLSVIGPSGCGKTTLLKIIAGVEQPDEGTIHISGLTDSPIPIVWQELRLFPWRTVLKNVSFPLELRDVDLGDIKKRAQEFLRIMGLEEFEEYYPWQISGGMAQRVAIARCLTTNPDCMLMDEPFASVDYITKQMLIQQITEIRRHHELTIMYVTHDIRDAIEVSDRIVVLSDRPAVVREIIKPTRDVSRDVELERYIWSLLKGES